LGAVVVNAGFLMLYGIIDRIKDMDLVMNEPPMVTILRRLKQSLWSLLLVRSCSLCFLLTCNRAHPVCAARPAFCMWQQQMNWCVWPAANLVNFYAVPDRFRVLYTNVVGALWSVYLSSIVSSNSK
jgi:hypothetical protein